MAHARLQVVAAAGCRCLSARVQFLSPNQNLPSCLYIIGGPRPRVLRNRSWPAVDQRRLAGKQLTWTKLNEFYRE
ncbi:hypothetical protein CRM22_010632 [Opisthorchis felineus]|uniref:Uncharacterized protein n=1 Tax=Opisthorchis felineus TaxID=147828 RepID=A0A4S2KR10_OPIFE|nr:hypothetical protein CRM22_010632 [Opisthorchis felineus]